METSTAEVLYTPDDDERVGTSIAVGPLKFGPTLVLASHGTSGGLLTTLTLNENGTVCESTSHARLPFRPSFMACTEKGNVVVALRRTLYEVGVSDQSGIWELMKLPIREAYVANGGHVVSQNKVIIGTNWEGYTDKFGQTVLVDLTEGRTELLLVNCRPLGGSFLHDGKFYSVDVPTREVRFFDPSSWSEPPKTLIDFKGYWRRAYPTGLIGPFAFEGNHFCVVTLANSVAGVGRVAVVCLETGLIAHDVKLPGAGQATGAVVSNGMLYIATSNKGYSVRQSARNPNAGCVFRVVAPPHLSNPPHVPLLIDIE
jgi:sugar lactone lactonase YvrE